jgi:hypothetical protein
MRDAALAERAWYSTHCWAASEDGATGGKGGRNTVIYYVMGEPRSEVAASPSDQVGW